MNTKTPIARFCASKKYDYDIIHAIPDNIKDELVLSMRTLVRTVKLSDTQKEKLVQMFIHLQQYKRDRFHNTPPNTVTITFGDVAENHVGNQKIGNMAASGFSIKDLRRMQAKLEDQYGAITEFVNLNDLLVSTGITGEDAAVLIVRNAANLFLGSTNFLADESANHVHRELVSLDWDKKFYNARKKTVQNKNARWNIIISEIAQEPNYSLGHGRVVAWTDTPLLQRVFQTLQETIGKKAQGLHAEGNYYHSSVSGIGWHGDSERKKVIAFRFGQTIPLAFQWYNAGVPIGPKATLSIHNGDMYVMSEKATGFDWSNRQYKTLHLRHSAGSSKYTTYKPKTKAKKK